MNKEIRFPFKLQTVLFSAIQSSRQAIVSETGLLEIQTQLSVIDNNYPKTLQINMHVSMPKGLTVFFDVELVAIFSHLEGIPIYPKDEIPNFINEQGLFMLWPYIVEQIKDLSIKMGLNPITIQTPHAYSFKPAVSQPDNAPVDQ